MFRLLEKRNKEVENKKGIKRGKEKKETKETRSEAKGKI